MEDAERVGYVVRNFERLQGLRYVPYGIAIAVLGVVGYLWFEPWSGFFDFRPLNDLVPAGLLVFAMVLHHYFGVYYGRWFGRVRERSRGETKFGWMFWLVVPTVFVLSLFRDSFGEFGLILLSGILVAVFVLGDLWVERHRLTVHWAFLAALAVVVCLLPMFGIFAGDAISLLLVPLGLILALGCLLDHLLLVRTLKPVPKEETDGAG